MAMEGVSVTILLGAEEGFEDVPVLVKAEPPVGSVRTPSDICVVIDVSASMGAEATIQSAGGSTESHGLSLLDIAKHGVKTVLKTLNANDRLSVVWFNQGADVLFGLTKMDEDGQQHASSQLDSLSESGGTNIWKGLSAALEVLRPRTEPGRLGHIMLLTDGQTSERKTVMANLERYKNQHERLPGTVSTFGFGYNIDSDLLCQISRYGAATFSFIPDAGFVGTIFVNTMSNLLVTVGREVYLDLEAEDGSEILGVMGGYSMTKAGDQVVVDLGTIQYGQSRSFVLRMKGANGLSLTGKLRYEDCSFSRVESNVAMVSPDDFQRDAMEVEVQMLRADFIETLTKAIEAAADRSEASLVQAQAHVKALTERILASPASDDEFVKALLEDATGQCAQAVSRSDWYWKWGCRYLPSIVFAQRTQQRNNFKDPSVQLYGGTIFKDVQTQADGIFNSLPPPTPSRQCAGDNRRGRRGRRRPAPRRAGAASRRAQSPELESPRHRVMSHCSTHSVPVSAAPQSMAAYNDRYGVCIDANSSAMLANGDMCPVGRLVKGDEVLTPSGGAAQVACVVRTYCASGRAALVKLPGGGRVTPYHPVRIDEQWRFPVEVAEVVECDCEAVCSLAVPGAAAVVLEGGVACATLGHGLNEGAAAHPYFGTDRVLRDLEGAPGFQAGLVDIRPDQVLRDSETGSVSGFRFDA